MLPEGQQLRTELVAGAVVILLDESVVGERMQQARGAALVDGKMLGDFCGSHAVARMLEQVQDFQALCQRLYLSHWLTLT